MPEKLAGGLVKQESLYQSGQSWCYKAVVRCLGENIEVYIRRNAYDEQSVARVSRWTDHEGWKEYLSFPIADTPANKVSYVQKRCPEVEQMLYDTGAMLVRAYCASQ